MVGNSTFSEDPSWDNMKTKKEQIKIIFHKAIIKKASNSGGINIF